MPGARGDFVGHIIPAVFVAENSISGTDVVVWEAPARCILADLDSTGTAAVVFSQIGVSSTTTVGAVQLRQITAGTGNLLSTAVTGVQTGAVASNPTVATSGVVSTTESAIIIEYGETVQLNVSTAFADTTGSVVVIAYFIGI